MSGPMEDTMATNTDCGGVVTEKNDWVADNWFGIFLLPFLWWAIEPFQLWKPQHAKLSDRERKVFIWICICAFFAGLGYVWFMGAGLLWAHIYGIHHTRWTGAFILAYFLLFCAGSSIIEEG